MSRTVVKGQLKHLVSDKTHLAGIQYAVRTVNTIVINAYIFFRLSVVKRFHEEVGADVDTFDRDVATRLAAAFPLGKDDFDAAIDVVSSTLEGRVGRPYGDAKRSKMAALHAEYDLFALRRVLPGVKPAATNLSYCLQYEATAMHTAYHNNVFMHFDKYVKRYVHTALAPFALAEYNVDVVRRLPATAGAALRRVVHIAVTDILDQRAPFMSRADLHPWLASVTPKLVPTVGPPACPARPPATPPEPAPPEPAPPGQDKARRRGRPAVVKAPSEWAAAQARLYDQKAHPERWLPHMVYMVAWLEGRGAKLYQPLPQRSSFVPCHIKLDTQGLFDLLVHDQSGVAGGSNGLRQLDEALEGTPLGEGASGARYDLPGVKRIERGKLVYNKNAFMAALPSIIAPALRDRVASDKFASARYRTAIWRAITKLGMQRRAPLVAHDGKTFNNMIETDGFAVSVHYVTPALYGQTMYNGGARDLLDAKADQRAAKATDEFTLISRMDASSRKAVLCGGGANTSLSADPGKGVLLHVTDADGRAVRYTAAQRRVETSQRRNTREQIAILDQKVPVLAPLMLAWRLRRVRTLCHKPVWRRHTTSRQLGLRCLRRLKDQRLSALAKWRIGRWRPRLTFAELQHGMQGGDAHLTACSCQLHRYCAYLRARREVEAPLTALYARVGFRRRRYRVFWGRRSSEDKFLMRLENAFGRGRYMLYGNWGRNPNLRGQPPTPGIGLRRRVHSRYKTLTVHEAMTSSVCPSCEARQLQHPRRRLQRHGEEEEGEELQSVEIHHLLRCPNELCAHRWWNRDQLGAVNILKTGLHCLHTGSWHPAFGVE